MHKITMLVLASALSLGTTAVFAQTNGAVGNNAGGSVGSSGAAKSPANINSNAAPNAGSTRAAAGAKVDTSSKKVDKSSKNVDASTKVTNKTDGKMAKNGKMAKKNVRGHAAYARAMTGHGAYAQARSNDRYNVIVNNRVVGRDPDARIRFELRRDDPAGRG